MNNKKQMMTKKEIEEAVSWILVNDTHNDFGHKYRMVMKELRGKADEYMVKRAVSSFMKGCC